MSVWHLPKVSYNPLSHIAEKRPLALLTDVESWERVGSLLDLPIVVQAEPERTDLPFLNYLADNLPSAVEVIYALGYGPIINAAKVVAHRNKLPLVILPTALDSDQLFEPHVELIQAGVMNVLYTGPASELIIDWDVILATEAPRRTGLMADMIAIITGLLDWKYADKFRRNPADPMYVPWAAGIAAGVAAQATRIAPEVGQGKVEAMRTLMDLTAVSVQLANQLGHARHQEGTEHYFALALEKNGVDYATHAEMLGIGILLTSALHGQSPDGLRSALEGAGIRLDVLRPADVMQAIAELPNLAAVSNLPHAIAHDINPSSKVVQEAIQRAGLVLEVQGWNFAANVVPPTAPADTKAILSQQPSAAAPTQNPQASTESNPASPAFPSLTQQPPMEQG